MRAVSWAQQPLSPFGRRAHAGGARPAPCYDPAPNGRRRPARMNEDDRNGEESCMARETIGMTQDEMLAFLDEILQQEAAEAATANGTSVEDELASAGFAAMRSASSYAIHLIDANNAYIARYLLDQGLIAPAGEGESA
jgi:hypothetical protein